MNRPERAQPLEWRWREADPLRRAGIEAGVARLLDDGEGVEWLRRRDARRNLARIRSDDGGSYFAKHYLAGDRHAWREAWKRALHLSAAEREWRALVRLRSAGVAVPEPLAHVRLASGERVIVTEWLEGMPLAAALATGTGRRELLAAVGARVRDLHAAGWVHRDLHADNVFVAERGPVLIDLQAAQRLPGGAARHRDLARLDHSLHRVLSLADRVRLRAAALGVARPFDAPARHALRAVGRAARARARAHAKSRADRSLRAGRRAEEFAAEGGHGLVSRVFDASAVRAHLAHTRDALPACGARSDPPATADREALVLRCYAASARDLWRGSAARRAWHLAHALEATGIACATPVAFLEWSRLGLPRGSALVLAAREPDPACPLAQRVEAHVALWMRLHETAFGTASLDPAALGLAQRGARVEARVDALEDLRFPARLRRAERSADLARLDAEWRRLGAPEPLRERARARYRRLLPC